MAAPWNATSAASTRLFLKGVTPESTVVATFSNGVVIPELHVHRLPDDVRLHHAALIVGAFAERMKFGALMLFVLLWVTLILLPDGAHGLVLGWSRSPSAKPPRPWPQLPRA
jgi:hypothetical protein